MRWANSELKFGFYAKIYFGYDPQYPKTTNFLRSSNLIKTLTYSRRIAKIANKYRK